MTFRRRSSWLVALALALAPLVWADDVRTARVAGSFYPADPALLRTMVLDFLAKPVTAEIASTKPRILISPHAGYPYSGPVAARAFREVQGRHYDGVVVVGFTHRQAFGGTSVDDRAAYQTPLGILKIDTKAVAFLKAQPGMTHVESAHDSQEHSMEVMLPFLQVALPDVPVVPMLMGRADPTYARHVAQALAKLADRGEYLFVFSTDLSHYHPYEQATVMDQQTVRALVEETSQAAARLFQAHAIEACGQGPIMAALALSEQLGYLDRTLLRYANSGDAEGTKDSVVGYGAIAMYPRADGPTAPLISPEAGMALVTAARQTLVSQLRGAPASAIVQLGGFPELDHPRGMFVTLRRQGRLRGCIGRTQTTEPLQSLLPTVALEAALHDARFQPLTAQELDDLTIEVSVLSEPRPVGDASAIVPGRDGVILRKGNRAGVFLPQVWQETGWTRLELLRELASQKAGLDPDAWQQAELFVFQDQAFQEQHEER